MNAQSPLGIRIPLTVVDIKDAGAYVDADVYGNLFVPHSQLPADLKIGDKLEVFLYHDGGRVLATAKKPYLELGMVGALRVNSIECGTAYLDLGIPKELVVPVSEQRGYFETGTYVLIYVAIDDDGRLFGTQRFSRYLSDVAPAHTYASGDEVTIVPLARTPLGLRVAVDDQYFGLIYRTELKQPLTLGKRMRAYILQQREDGKLDLGLQRPGRGGVEQAADEIWQLLQRAQGQLPFGDKSDPEEIEDYLHISKGKFKKAIGALYKQRLIEIYDDKIVLVNNDKQDKA
ncbi:MAG: hypothetical protein IAA31_06750 [Candidatus Anaerobiospirillum merdipullorum]|uniref:GntR family transcriptional regulator n=1 Tax=Candidatus Anaerobiospirillum merdipullorum TaxID=2838450 RepID=A0A9E2KN85_9GAMM|nr:hypothetical protein [Candidatus Anaerobiospirillum merdipullorum]